MTVNDFSLGTTVCRPPITAYDAPVVRQRSVGRVRLAAGAGPGPTRILDLAEAGPSRLRFPRGPGPLEAVLVNTAGGIACGDAFSVTVDLAAGADLVFTTAAAEKIYRSDGPESRIETALTLAAGARLVWLPQETILFDRARLRRRFEADLAADAGLLAVEIIAFGREAGGERIADGFFTDDWRIRRDARLIYADGFHLQGPISELLMRPAIGGGARACATFLDASPGAEARLEEVRAHLEATVPSGVEAAASAWNGHIAVRALGLRVGPLREAMARFLTAYRSLPMPRVWQT